MILGPTKYINKTFVCESQKQAKLICKILERYSTDIKQEGKNIDYRILAVTYPILKGEVLGLFKLPKEKGGYNLLPDRAFEKFCKINKTRNDKHPVDRRR